MSSGATLPGPGGGASQVGQFGVAGDRTQERRRVGDLVPDFDGLNTRRAGHATTFRFLLVSTQAESDACPACGSGDCAFRSRRQIEADPEKGEPGQLETKYSCKACNE